MIFDGGDGPAADDLRREVAALRRQLEDARQALVARDGLEERLVQAQKAESVGLLAGGVAHDFNNVLCVVLGYSGVMLQHLPAGHPLRADVEEIHAAGLRATELTRRLLAFSRSRPARPEVVDPSEVVAGMERMLRRLLPEDVELAVVPAVRPAWVLADAGQLEQVVMNLALNARDAMPGGGRLCLETTLVDVDQASAADHPGVAAGAYVLLAVSDTGAGMDAATRARIFEPFFTTKDKGTGLGLSMVLDLVRRSRGHVRVHSEPGEGATFAVYLPRTPRADLVAGEAPAAPPATDAPRGSETILLVEDEEPVRVVTGTILRRSGYAVLEAPGAGEALLACELFAGPIHLLLTDVVLPRMSGKQLADRLTAARPGLRVLCMSGYADHALVQREVLDQGVAFLEKPITPEALLKKVRGVLGA